MIRNKNRTGKFTTQKWSETKTNKSDKFTNEQEIKGNLKKKKQLPQKYCQKKRNEWKTLQKNLKVPENEQKWKIIKMNKHEK